jgi:hypothetical protein
VSGVGLFRLASIEATACISSTFNSKRIEFSLLLLKEVAFKAWFWGLPEDRRLSPRQACPVVIHP